jgi:hypothetical protein
MFGRNTSRMHVYVTAARRRAEQMDKALTKLERMARKAPARSEAKSLITDLKKRRAQFQDAARQMKLHANAAEARMKKLSAAGAISWSAFRTALAKSRKALVRANQKTGKAIKRALR